MGGVLKFTENYHTSSLYLPVFLTLDSFVTHPFSSQSIQLGIGFLSVFVLISNLIFFLFEVCDSKKNKTKNTNEKYDDKTKEVRFQ